MANKRKMECGRWYFAVGMEGSMADLQEQYLTCYECNMYIKCCRKKIKTNNDLACKKYFQSDRFLDNNKEV